MVVDAWRRQFGSSAPYIFEPALRSDRGTWRRGGLRPISAVLRDASKTAQERAFEEIARPFAPMFGVSVQAMAIRLQDLGLLMRDKPLAAFY